ncbi:MAG: Panacea domain-containing protein [Bryobacteraceae bacterium]
MNYMKLIKLLYLLDRSALLTWGRPVTTDRYVSMERGPVVSRILDLIREEPEPGSVSFWRRHISGRKAYSVRLVSDPGSGELSRAEEDLIDTVFAEHGRKNQWELVDFCHGLPEWKDPEGSSVPLGYTDILQAGGKTEDEIREVVAELNTLATAEIRYSPE